MDARVISSHVAIVAVEDVAALGSDASRAERPADARVYEGVGACDDESVGELVRGDAAEDGGLDGDAEDVGLVGDVADDAEAFCAAEVAGEEARRASAVAFRRIV